MKRDTILNLVTAAATLVGAGMTLFYDPQTLSTVSVPGVTVFTCFLIVGARLLWNWRESRAQAKAREARNVAEGGVE